MGQIRTVYCEEYTAKTQQTSMRKLGPVAYASEKQGLSELIEPKECEIEEKLKTLHDPKYVNAFLEGIDPLARSQGWDWTPEIRDGVLAINRGQLTAAEIALEEGVAANVAQGFHHAVYHEGMGYCTFNGLALVAQEHLGVEGRGRRQPLQGGVGHLALGADHHVDGHVVAAVEVGVDRGEVGLRPQPGHLARDREDRVGHLAGDHVDLVGMGGGDDHVRVARARPL